MMPRIEELERFLEYMEDETLIGVPRFNEDGSGCYSSMTAQERKEFARGFLRSGLLPPKPASQKKRVRVKVCARRGWARPGEFEVDITRTFRSKHQAKAFVEGALWAGQAHQGFVGWENAGKSFPNWQGGSTDDEL